MFEHNVSTFSSDTENFGLFSLPVRFSVSSLVLGSLPLPYLAGGAESLGGQ